MGSQPTVTQMGIVAKITVIRNANSKFALRVATPARKNGLNVSLRGAQKKRADVGRWKVSLK